MEKNNKGVEGDDDDDHHDKNSELTCIAAHLIPLHLRFNPILIFQTNIMCIIYKNE